MTKNVTISLYPEDAHCITSHSIPDIAVVGDLFHACYEMLDDNKDELTLELALDEEAEGWMRSIISEELDESGVFEQILEKCQSASELGQSKFEQLLEKCQTPVQITVH